MLSWCKIRFLHNNSCVAAFIRQYGRYTDQAEFPRITVPQPMIEKLHRHNLRKEKEKARKSREKLTSLVITSKRREFQFYKGQKFDVFDAKKLASHGWKHRNSGADYFTLLSHASNPAMRTGGDGMGSFTDLQLDDRLLQFLEAHKITAPTQVQARLIPVVKEGKHAVCASETGSGKTLAYLLPLFHNILKLKKAGQYDESMTNAPLCIVMVPSRELVKQVKEVCESMEQYTGLVPVALRQDTIRQLKTENTKVDILIGNPYKVQKLIASGGIDVSRLTSLVVDEADTLLDDSFSNDTLAVLRRLQVGGGSGTELGDSGYVSEGVQVTLVSATYPQGLEQTVGDVLPFDSMEKVKTSGLHQLMPHVPQKFMKMKSKDKLPTLVEMLKRKPDVNYMVFVNSTRCCYWLSQTLTEVGLKNLCVSKEESVKDRQSALESFHRGENNILLCTDILSRGIDTRAVDHVVNFEFPHFLSDYIHRAGRVGRVGGKNTGHVTSFICQPFEVDLVWKIEVAARQKSELHNVNANIKRKLEGRVNMQKKGLDL
ncbi:probable ATP-dependent RNA helicase DDX28 [Mya arenaria]|uniref:probable ATP-dependent RNA helicase DDX28 n=1 Tax=Mya arenaria TaxID=6604 RepID=UPI0022E73EB5|nr:probable ATP-dependent RNA helicase DDX28 [Mya arenaria]